jgi:CspA family cold shock protein
VSRERGTVKFFDQDKGFGFIRRPGNDDAFVHYSQIKGNGFKVLEQGQEVEFAVEVGPKGAQELDVSPV